MIVPWKMQTSVCTGYRVTSRGSATRPLTIQAPDQNRYLIFVNRMFVNIDRAKARYAGRIGFLTSKSNSRPILSLLFVPHACCPSLPPPRTNCFREFFGDRWFSHSNALTVKTNVIMVYEVSLNTRYTIRSSFFFFFYLFLGRMVYRNGNEMCAEFLSVFGSRWNDYKLLEVRFRVELHYR